MRGLLPVEDTQKGWLSHIQGRSLVEETSFYDGFLDSSVDWRSRGAVSSVENQGRCNSCWSFATAGIVEGSYAIKTGNLIKLSTQQQVDCNSNCGGCDPSAMQYALDYVVHNPLMSWSDYPYTGVVGSCRYNSRQGVTTINSYAYVQPNSANELKAAIMRGPTMVAV